MKDSQKQKVYNSEFRVRPNVENVNSHEQVQEFVDRVLSNKKVLSLYGKQLTARTVNVAVRRGKRFATGGYSGINIPESKWAWNKLVILHEIAHVIVCRTVYGCGVPVTSHGWQFCEVFLNLVKAVLGTVTHDELKEQYKKNRVKFKAPVKRELTPEQRAALVERAAHARQVRMNNLRG